MVVRIKSTDVGDADTVHRKKQPTACASLFLIEKRRNAKGHGAKRRKIDDRVLRKMREMDRKGSGSRKAS